MNNFCADWEYFTLKKGMGKEDGSGRRSRKTRKQGQWQHESPFKDVLEQVKRSADCGPQTMRRAYSEMTLGGWESLQEECRKEGKLCEWIFDRLHQAYEKVAVDDRPPEHCGGNLKKKARTS